MSKWLSLLMRLLKVFECISVLNKNKQTKNKNAEYLITSSSLRFICEELDLIIHCSFIKSFQLNIFIYYQLMSVQRQYKMLAQIILGEYAHILSCCGEKDCTLLYF